MVEVIRILGIGILTMLCYLIVKPVKPEVAIFISMVGCFLILINAIDGIINIIDIFSGFIEKTGLNKGLISSVLKIIGVGYLIEIASSMCVSSGCTGISDALNFAGKIIILIMSMPIVTYILDIIIGILP